MKSNNTKIAEITNELIGDISPADWISFLFDTQNALVSYGHMEGMTRLGTDDISGKFAELKNFFEDLREIDSK